MRKVPYEELIDYDESENKYLKKELQKHYYVENSYNTQFLNHEYKTLLILFIISILVRLFNISQPNSTVFDEVHFITFMQKILKRQHFFDIHPPLSKLLITFLAYQFGIQDKALNLDFENIGSPFNNTSIPYIAIRTSLALLGVMVVLMTYINLRLFNLSKQACVCASLMVLLDNALTTQNRLIFLDSPLLFLISASSLSFTIFNSLNDRPFSKYWWISLISTGTLLGLTVSAKLNGIFTYLLVGVFTAIQLWMILINPKKSFRFFFNHLGSRILCLIVIPFLVYTSTFWVQFKLLNERLDYSSLMTPEYEMTLKNSGLIETNKLVAYGSQIRIHHVNTEGGYLHSHNHPYPAGSGQQQVTLYPFRDENNLWMIKKLPSLSQADKSILKEIRQKKLQKDNIETKPETIKEGPQEIVELKGETLTKKIETELEKERKKKMLKEENGPTFKYDMGSLLDQPIEYVKNGDFVRLFHVQTEKYLHSHNVRPVFSEKDYINEISGYGFPDFEGDSNDYFMVDIKAYDTRDPQSKNQLMSIYSQFNLIHVNTGCALYSRQKKLPEWAFGQQEVFCIREGQPQRALWRIDTSLHPQFNETSERVIYDRAGFWSKFFEYNLRMIQTNNNLEGYHHYQSSPQDWPFLKRGISYWRSSTNKLTSVYFIGNPNVWKPTFISVLIYFFLVLLIPLFDQRRVQFFHPQIRFEILHRASFFALGWAINYIPYFLMKRQLFLHHYLPALTFSIMLFSYLADLFLLRKLPSKWSWASLSLFLIFVIVSYFRLAPLVYSTKWSSVQSCLDSRLGSSWDDYCS